MAKYDSIFEAIKEEDVKWVRYFLKHNQVPIEDGGWNPLHEASKKGNLPIVKAILQYLKNNEDHEFNVNSYFEIIDRDSDYRGTALSEALLNGNIDIAKFLVKNGANVNGRYYTQDQNTPEWFFGEYELATSQGVCWWLADQNLLDNLFIKHGLSIDYEDYKENNALYYAMQSGDISKVNWLLCNGSDPQQYMMDEEMGNVPCMVFAVRKYLYSNRKKSEYFEIIKLLLRYTSSLGGECSSHNNKTVLDIILEESDDSDLDRLFGLQNIRKIINHTEKESPCPENYL